MKHMIGGFIIKDKKEETLEDENMKANVQVIEYRQLPDIKSNDVKRSLLDSMNQEVEVKDGRSHVMKSTMGKCSFKIPI